MESPKVPPPETEKPQSIYKNYSTIVKFYKEVICFWIGFYYVGSYSYRSEVGKILTEWRKSEEDYY